jgi:hypothetical protein
MSGEFGEAESGPESHAYPTDVARRVHARWIETRLDTTGSMALCSSSWAADSGFDVFVAIRSCRCPLRGAKGNRFGLHSLLNATGRGEPALLDRSP